MARSGSCFAFGRGRLPARTEGIGEVRRLGTVIVARVCDVPSEVSLASGLARIRREHPREHVVVEYAGPPAIRPAVALIAQQCGLVPTVSDATDISGLRANVPGPVVIAGALEAWSHFSDRAQSFRAFATVLRQADRVSTATRLGHHLSWNRRTMADFFRRVGLPTPAQMLRISKAISLVMARHRAPNISWGELARCHGYPKMETSRRHVRLLLPSLQCVDSMPPGAWEPLVWAGLDGWEKGRGQSRIPGGMV